MVKRLLLTFATAFVLTTLAGGTALHAQAEMTGDNVRAIWSCNAVVLCEVERNPKPEGGHATKSETIRPLGTISGPFDSGAVQSIEGTPIFGRPRPGQIHAIVLERANPVSGRFAVPDGVVRLGHVELLKFPEELAGRVRDATIEPNSNKNIANLLAYIRSDRSAEITAKLPPLVVVTADGFWASHSLIYGAVLGTTQGTDSAKPLTIDFRPLVTLSGALDCGVTRRLSLAANAAATRKADPAVWLGSNALILVVQDKDSFSVATDSAEFMPNDHAAICKVAGFGDPQVTRALKAVQQSRASGYARALAATPLAGKTASINSHGHKALIEFRSETKADIDGNGWIMERLGASFLLFDNHVMVLQGTISGKQISGVLYKRGVRISAFDGALP
jgi:hypothetical protein